MSSTRHIIKRELLKNSLTVEQLLQELEQGCGTKDEITYHLDSMIRSGEVRLDEDLRLYVNETETPEWHPSSVGRLTPTAWENAVSVIKQMGGKVLLKDETIEGQ